MLIGVDLGGTKIAVAAVRADGGVAARIILPTNSQQGPTIVLDRIVAAIHSVVTQAGIRPSDLSAIGVGVPGVFDLARGETIFLPNLAGTWPHVAVGATLQAAFDCSVWLINDARAFVLAESLLGAGSGANTVVGLTLGTGIGGGIVIGGRLHLGLDGTAGEIGHMTVNPDGPRCGCGNYGCIETYASGTAIAARGADAAAHGRSLLLAKIASQNQPITPEHIRQAAEAGDNVARDILWNAGRMLGVAVANLVTTLSPDRVILGGSVARLGSIIFDPVRAAVAERVHAVPIARIKILPAELGGDAGAIGAALWAAGQQAAV